MKPAVRYQSPILLRRSFKPERALRVTAYHKLTFVFRPSRKFGVKPRLETVP